MQQLIKVVGKSGIQSGTSANGDWERQTLLGETMDDNPTVIPFEFFGIKNVRKLTELNVGDLARVTFRIRGREFNDRWFCNVEAIRVEPLVLAGSASGSTSQATADPDTEHLPPYTGVTVQSGIQPSFNPDGNEVNF